MLDLSTENKALCFEDSTLKPLYIFIYYWQGEHWQYFTTIDEAIVMESMELDEGVLEGNNFELGSFVTHSMKVQWQNNGIRYKDMLAVPVQKIGSQYIAYFDGAITKEEVAENGQTVTAEISSLLSQKLDIDVLPTLKEQSGTRLPIMVYHTLNNLGIDIRTDWADRFANADYDMFLNESTLPQSLTLSEFLKQMGEFLGGHIVAQEKRVVNSLDDMTSYQPTGRLEIGFMRLANVDTVAQSNTKPLPSEYKRVEYIESNGTQYIDTNVLPDDTTKIQIKVAMSEYTGGVIVGYRNTELDVFRLFNYNGNTYLDYGSGGNYNRLIGDNTYDGRINKGKIYDLEIGNRYVKDLDTGRNKVYGSAVSFDEKSFSIGIFNGGDITEDSSSGKVFYCKIYKSNTLVADLVPCVRVGDNNVGMYDLVRNEFFANQGADSFIAPNAIETYTLPYYINLYADKANRVQFDQIRVVTKTGDMLNYQTWWKIILKPPMR